MATTLKYIEVTALRFVNHRIDFYETNPDKAPDFLKIPGAILRMSNVKTHLAIKVVQGDIPILDFKVFKRRHRDSSGIEVYFAVICASERIDSQSEAFITQKINANETIDQFVIAKLDDKREPNVTVIYQLSNATILHMTAGGQYTGIVATAKVDSVQFYTDSGTIQSSYDSTTGVGS